MKRILTFSGLLLCLYSCSPSPTELGQNTVQVSQNSLASTDIDLDAGMSSKAISVRFDGIYESEKSDLPNYKMFLRFYKDGTLVYKRSQGTIQDVKLSMNRFVYCRRCRSSYEVSDNTISFKTYRESNAPSGGILHSNEVKINSDSSLTLVGSTKYDNLQFGPLSFVFRPENFAEENLRIVTSVNDPSREERIRINDEWDLYTNSEMGFSLHLPTFVQTLYDSKKNEIKIEQPDSYGWTVEMFEMSEADTLESAIKEIGGKDCKVKSQSSRSNYVLFGATADKLDVLGSNKQDCRLVGNGAWQFHYSPERLRIIYWNAGQELHFNTTGKDYDNEMMKSFLFVD